MFLLGDDFHTFTSKFICTHSENKIYMYIYITNEMISVYMVILSLLLIQEGQLSVTGMCTKYFMHMRVGESNRSIRTFWNPPGAGRNFICIYHLTYVMSESNVIH